MAQIHVREAARKKTNLSGEFVKINCFVCGEKKNPLAMRISSVTKKSECIECTTDGFVTEKEFLETQQKFWDSADKIWKQLGV